jgi:hypothetical protein
MVVDLVHFATTQPTCILLSPFRLVILSLSSCRPVASEARQAARCRYVALSLTFLYVQIANPSI